MTNKEQIDEGIFGLNYKPEEILAFNGNQCENFIPTSGNWDGEEFYVITRKLNEVSGTYDISAPNAFKDVSYPGGLLMGNDGIVDGCPQALVADRDSMDISVDLPGLEKDNCITVASPDYKNVSAAIDTLIGTLEEASNASNDRVKVGATNNGFVMKGNDYSFSMILQNAYGVDDVQKFWYGPYDSGNFLMKVFDENKISGLSENEDSAASFYWDIGDERESSKKIRISMESVN